MIYFDNAATTQMSDVALDALVSVSKMNYGNPSSVYSFGRESKRILEEARKIIASCIGANSDEIYFTSGGTESDNWAISHAKEGFDCIITSQVEHHAVLNAVKSLRNRVSKIYYIPVSNGCIVDMKSIEENLTNKKAFVSIMFQNNETGVKQPIASIAAQIHNNNLNAVFHTDAVQAIGHTRINVKELGVDMLSASAHKFNGPKGVGFLYVRKGVDILPMVLGGGQESGLRSGTENVAGIYAMAKALEDNIVKLAENEQRISNLEKRLIYRLNEEKVDFIINGDIDNKASGIINIAFTGMEGEAMLNYLDSHDISISTGSACNSHAKERSHVLSAMGLTEDMIDSSIRISIGNTNTEEEIDIFVKHISKYKSLVNQVSL